MLWVLVRSDHMTGVYHNLLWHCRQFSVIQDEHSVVGEP